MRIEELRLRFLPCNPEPDYLLPANLHDILAPKHLCFFLQRARVDRPLIPPQKLRRALRLQMLYTIRSARLLIAENLEHSCHLDHPHGEGFIRGAGADSIRKAEGSVK